ncbi:MAG: recombinase family protein [Eubacteriales bacterium]|nr:recombinase family protein [Eubacteriales bacterium]
MSGNSCRRAGLYIRLSREDAGEGESQSVTNQRALLGDAAAQLGVEAVDTYIDDGYSGTNFDRPAFQRMLKDIRAGKIDMVMTKDMSRLGRDYIDTGYYLEKFFPRWGVRYVSLLDGVDTAVDSSANDITPFRALLNDLYARDISRKIIAVKRDKQKRGLFIGGKAPYGYRMDARQKNHIVPDPEAAEVVRQVFAMAGQGESCTGIARHLTKRDVPSPAVYAGLRRDGVWSGERIADMLRNRVYLGEMVQGKSRRLSYKTKVSRRLPPREWAVVPGTHEPLVDQACFAQAQRRLQARARTRRRTYDHPLKGLLRCAVCGRPLGLVNRPGKDGREKLYFICRACQKTGKAPLGAAQRIARALAEKMELLVKENLSRAEGEALAQEVARAENGCGDADRTRAELQALNGQIQRAYLARLDEELEQADFLRIYTAMKKRRAELEKRAQAARETPCASDWAQDTVRAFFRGGYAQGDFLTDVLEKAELGADKTLRLTLRAPADLPYPRRAVSRIEKKAISELNRAFSPETDGNEKT